MFLSLSSTTLNSNIVSALVSSDQVQIRRQPGLAHNTQQQNESEGSSGSWLDIKSKFGKQQKVSEAAKYEVYAQDPVYAEVKM